MLLLGGFVSLTMELVGGSGLSVEKMPLFSVFCSYFLSATTTLPLCPQQKHA